MLEMVDVGWDVVKMRWKMAAAIIEIVFLNMHNAHYRPLAAI